VLALGIGIYVGRAGLDRAMSERLAPSVMPFANHAAAAESASVPVQPAQPPARAQAGGPASVVTSVPRQPTPSDAPTPLATLARREPAANVALEAEARPKLDAVDARASDVVIVAPLSLDSARALLDADPLAVPGLAVRAIHQGRMPGYSAVVVVEQVIASGTPLTVITARPAASRLGNVGVTGASPAAKARPSQRVEIARERAADSLGVRALQSAPDAPRSDTRTAGLWRDVRGPLAADSLAALRRRLEPLRP
jgi:hypothetical protein